MIGYPYYLEKMLGGVIRIEVPEFRSLCAFGHNEERVRELARELLEIAVLKRLLNGDAVPRPSVEGELLLLRPKTVMELSFAWEKLEERDRAHP